jgi:hypothetical protein
MRITIILSGIAIIISFIAIGLHVTIPMPYEKCPNYVMSYKPIGLLKSWTYETGREGKNIDNTDIRIKNGALLGYDIFDENSIRISAQQFPYPIKINNGNNSLFRVYQPPYTRFVAYYSED